MCIYQVGMDHNNRVSGPECNPDSFQATEAAGAELRDADGDADAGARRVEEAGEARSFAIAIAIAGIANSLCNSQELMDRLSKTSSGVSYA